ncbi:hypothetical protein [Vitiosangium sp. GDMCC 1.1324]|uniref:hypothetical protein n=1 Tax=Vitiosangium sp. (strain GDMCC 1.1324) TaxID=2138576 RepID=UPI000D340488|nr:hypothetical protein [Vitiosangium sp. GDMCC 1.1324]PTL84975.1 hypothetical protein DAT35_07985 [Vitiosangium sp. GDMCC 1.1324]
MKTKTTIAGLMMAVGLLATGCGGAVTAVDEQSNLATRKDELPSCWGEAYEHISYSEPELINAIGGWHCICGSQAIVYGRWQSPYYTETEPQTCQ